jgi:hypothetical protein
MMTDLIDMAKKSAQHQQLPSSFIINIPFQKIIPQDNPLSTEAAAMNRLFLLLSIASLSPCTEAFTARNPKSAAAARITQSPTLFSTPNNNADDNLGEKFGGFTTKQRLREEIESPFRKVRLAFFSFSSVSAFVALYFSALVS